MASKATQSGVSVETARNALCEEGWTLIGTGNWSWTYASPDGHMAARVTPWDPAYQLHAEACLAGEPNRYLPRIDRIVQLAGEGYVTFMERLWPAEEDLAAELCGRIGLGNDSGYEIPLVEDEPSDQHLASLRRRLRQLIVEGAERYTLWGGSDIPPSNVMVDAEGQLKVVDPVFLRGPAIVEALQAANWDLLTDFTCRQLQAFLRIPVFPDGPETEVLRSRVKDFCARPAS